MVTLTKSSQYIDEGREKQHNRPLNTTRLQTQWRAHRAYTNAAFAHQLCKTKTNSEHTTGSQSEAPIHSFKYQWNSLYAIIVADLVSLGFVVDASSVSHWPVSFTTQWTTNIASALMLCILSFSVWFSTQLSPSPWPQCNSLTLCHRKLLSDDPVWACSQVVEQDCHNHPEHDKAEPASH